MITKSAQNWEPGHLVKVGFLNLVVVAKIPTPHDHAPDAYLLTNVPGDKIYKFVPHCGVERITKEDAIDLFEESIRLAGVDANKVITKAKEVAEVSAIFKKGESQHG